MFCEEAKTGAECLELREGEFLEIFGEVPDSVLEFCFDGRLGGALEDLERGILRSKIIIFSA